MRALAIELFGLGGLSGTRIVLDGGGVGENEARPLTVLFGADGVGKTTILSALASTRPGHALPIIPRRKSIADEDEPHETPYATTDWILGDDDPQRPHPLRVVSPNTPRTAPIDDGEAALK